MLTCTNIRSGVSALIAIIMVLAGGGFSSSAKAGVAPDSLIAYWNFNGLESGIQNPNVPIQPSYGLGVLDISTFGGVVQTFSGANATTLNALFGDPAGFSIGFHDSPPGSGSGTGPTFQFSMAGRQDLQFTFALSQGAQSYQSHTWSWSLDGISFTQLDGINTVGVPGFNLKEVDFSQIVAINDAPDVWIRLTFDDIIASNHLVAIDNVQIHGSLIPAPGALALLGVAGLFGSGSRRRRRTC